MTLGSRVLLATLLCLVSSASAAKKPIFEKDVLPIFRKYCFNCHGKSSPQVGLELRTARLVMRGSQNGPVISKGNPDQSILWKKIAAGEMPLPDFKLKLKPAEKETVRRWIQVGAPSSQSTALPPRAKKQFARFKDEVLPIFAKKCLTCHGEETQEGQLDLRSVATVVRGSKSGPVVVEGFSEKSILIRKVSSHAMPPKDSGKPLTVGQIRTITTWIDAGHFVDYVDLAPRVTQGFAKAKSDAISEESRQFWAFKKPVISALPTVRANNRIRTPIDRFVLAKLEANGLGFSSDASRQTLLRRAYFDLTGLPPSPAETRDFRSDSRPDAYERLIDRLLASPRYGERWGRHWLDSVGYVDTSDKDFNPTTASLAPGIWRYRDYVIKATNQDKPWDRFLIEQFAGDELVDWRNAKRYTPKMLELLVATGYLRNALDATDEDISNLPFDRYEALFKLMERVSTSTLGMTLNCARCHDHKFDPLPQADYYRFLSFFTAAFNPSQWLPPKRRFLYQVSKAEEKLRKQTKARLTQQINASKKLIARLQQEVRGSLLAKRLAGLPASIRQDAQAAIRLKAKKRNAVQKFLVSKFGKSLTISTADVNQALSPQQRQTIAKSRRQIGIANRQMPKGRLQKVQALWDLGKAPTIRILQRGDVDFPGRIIQPSFPQVLSPAGKSLARPSAKRKGDTTGLRLAFAEWLTNRDHPLTARVIVNRMWHHHFGQGIVSTPGNFGKSGSRPTHPKLLDWLANDLMDHGWSAKRLHRLILTSTVYRQSSARRRGRGKVAPNVLDPTNRLLWRMNMRRLEAEAIRDAVLAVSAQADYEVGGEAVQTKTSKDGLMTVRAGTKPNGVARRSVFVLARRNYPLTFLRLFDFPTIDANCTARVPSATPLQSLTMMNSQFLTTSATQLARRAEREATEKSLNGLILSAYWITFARLPAASELADARAHVEALAKIFADNGHAKAAATKKSFERLVHMLLCSNEFLYVD